MPNGKKVIVAAASGLALTGTQASADIVAEAAEGELDRLVIAETLDTDELIVFADDGALLPPLPEAADEVGFDERYAQTWGGGTGNDGLLRAPDGGDRILPRRPNVDRVSRPAVGAGKAPVAARAPTVRKRAGDVRKVRRPGTKKKR